MKVFVADHNQVLADIAQEFEVVKDIERADRILLWTDIMNLERSIARLGKSLGIPVIVVQHGRRGSSRYFPPFNEPIIADKLCVWGIRDKQALIEAGHPAKKIAVTGTTIFQYLIPRKKHKGTNIVFCPEHWDSEVAENKMVAKELRKLKNIKITTKIIEGHNADWYDNPVFSNRKDPNHLKICAEVLSTADLLVSISESTFELFAQYLDIPTVTVADWNPKAFGGDERYFKYRRIVSEATAKTSLDNLVPTIKKHLANPGLLKAERSLVVREEGGTNIKDPLKAVLNAI